MKTFSMLLKLKDYDKFEWLKEHQDAFTQIKALHAPFCYTGHRLGRCYSLYAHSTNSKRPNWKMDNGAVQFSLQYVHQKAVKGQALADFLAQHPSPYSFRGNNVEIGMVETCDNYWTMYFDGSSTSTSTGITFKHISLVRNTDADELAQIASKAQLLGSELGQVKPVVRPLHPALVNQQVLQHDHVIRTRVMSLPSLLERDDPMDIYAVETLLHD
ncbi:unnamed protein product [Malus baccata var. baccata]